VILIGKKQDFRLDFCRPPSVSREAAIIQADPDPFEIGRNREVEVRLDGDLGAIVEQLAAAADGSSWPEWAPWVAELQTARQAQRRRMDDLVAAERKTPLHPLAIFQAAEQVLPPAATLLFDVGDFGLWGRAYMRAERPGGWYWPGPLGHLGVMLPMALGAAVARPPGPVVCFAGDGAIGFYFMELDTAIRHQLPVVVVVGNDAAWGIDKSYQQAWYGRLIGTDLRPIRYDRLMAELGGHGEHVERPEDLPAALRRAIESGRPALVDVTMRSTPSPSAALKIRTVQAQQLASRASES
jgi:acetolactate synthase-1/2/3 large subunit